jgi:hypothetical protein
MALRKGIMIFLPLVLCWLEAVHVLLYDSSCNSGTNYVSIDFQCISRERDGGEQEIKNGPV